MRNSKTFAPDGRRLAMQMVEGQQPGIWVYEWTRDSLTKLTFDAVNSRPVWTPDGRRIAFASDRGDRSIFNL